MQIVINHTKGNKNEKLHKIMLDSLYPFQFNTDAGKTLQKSYNLIVNSYFIVKNNPLIFQSILGWNNKEYIKFLNSNYSLCDQIFMLTHTYLKYQNETLLFNNIVLELENLYFTMFNDDQLITQNDYILIYYNNVKEICKIYDKLRMVYTAEVDKKLLLDDIFLKRYEAVIANIQTLYKESKEEGL